MNKMVVAAVWERKRLAMTIGLMSFCVGLAYLLLKVDAVSGGAGYDFRYLWVAANVWASGMNPYTVLFLEFSEMAIAEGHVPLLWPYPPTWWPLSFLLPLDDILAANRAFNLATVAMLLAAAMIVGTALAALWGQRRGASSAPLPVVVICQGVVFLVLAATEATAIHVSVGQTTALSVFGGALLLLGQRHDSATWRILGFVLLLLKPQLGIPFAAAYLVASPRALHDLIPAGILSVLLAMPAIVASPSTIADFLGNALSYRDVSLANHPAATTGLRSAVHVLTGIEIGNFVPLGVSCLVAMLLVWRHGGRQAAPTMMVPLTALAVLAIGPLHYYDFTLVLLALPLVVVLPGVRMWLFILGFALIFRADNVGAAICFYDPEVPIFKGSRLSNVGAALMLLVAIGRFGRRGPAAAGA